MPVGLLCARFVMNLHSYHGQLLAHPADRVGIVHVGMITRSTLRLPVARAVIRVEGHGSFWHACRFEGSLPVAVTSSC